MYVYMHIRVYIYMYIYTYICTYIYGRVEEGEVTTADNYERRRRKHVPVEEDVSKCERRSQSLRWSVSMTKKKKKGKTKSALELVVIVGGAGVLRA